MIRGFEKKTELIVTSIDFYDGNDPDKHSLNDYTEILVNTELFNKSESIKKIINREDNNNGNT